MYWLSIANRIWSYHIRIGVSNIIKSEENRSS